MRRFGVRDYAGEVLGIAVGKVADLGYLAFMGEAVFKYSGNRASGD